MASPIPDREEAGCLGPPPSVCTEKTASEPPYRPHHSGDSLEDKAGARARHVAHFASVKEGWRVGKLRRSTFADTADI